MRLPQRYDHSGFWVVGVHVKSRAPAPTVPPVGQQLLQLISSVRKELKIDVPAIYLHVFADTTEHCLGSGDGFVIPIWKVFCVWQYDLRMKHSMTAQHL